jgi:glyoxylase-like metal-dependent hydrolase (beta-lactamase superfamily II)
MLYHFDQELNWMKDRVSLHPFESGDEVELPDAKWEVVKTEHTDHSVGFIIESSERSAYLVDSITPPPETRALNERIVEFSPSSL